jgi:lysophospholipase L1-like esterase
MRRSLGLVVLVVAGTLIAPALVEGLVGLALAHPRRLGSRVLGAVEQVHLDAEWPFVQLTAACARWDPELTYTLRPPGCTIVDREFTVRYSVDDAGLRDTAAALVSPEIIVLGDSYAMGWGVADDEAFPKVLERHLRRRVLNAGVPSYGTARELALLARLDRSALRAVILQFCWNDVDENRAWATHGGHLPIIAEADYEREVAAHAAALRYWPGKYAFTLAHAILGRIVRVRDAHADDTGEVSHAVDDVLAILAAHRDLLGTRPVVVLPMCDHETAVAATLLARAAAAQDVAEQVSVVDAAPSIEARHLYPLDGHPNAAGHRLLARLVARELAARGIMR